MRDPRRLVAVLLLGLLISVGGATVLRNAEAGDVVAGVAKPTTTTTTTTIAPATTVAPAAAVRANKPVRVPSNPYAPEKLQQIGDMLIPKIGLRHTIYEGITLRTIDHGPSHWPGTAMPGQTGNAVFAGHRVTHSKPFRNIDQLVAGDEVIFNIAGKRSVYRMTSSKIVTPKALDIVHQTPTATATLFACHPPGSAKFRYVVLLELVQENRQQATPAAANEPPPTQPPPSDSPATLPSEPSSSGSGF
ncbi:MAG TPA: class E sortase [Acidimicrobiales bacterium]|nr:class E sortase [Acidimicrobiales bacterium]